MSLMRHEDLRLITGNGKFTADWNLPGQLHAVMIRSDHGHATLDKIDLDAVRAAPGVVAVFTSADVEQAGFTTIPSGPDIVGVDGSKQKKAPLPVLATDKLRFVGQPIAMVVAESAIQARDAAEQVIIEYGELPAASTVAESKAAGAPQLHDGIDGNCSLTFDSGDKSAVEAAFSSAAKTSRIRIHSQRLSGAPMEPRACMAAFDSARGVTVVYTPTQGVLGMKASLSAVTASKPEELEIVADDVGGSFGLRGGCYPETALVVLASRKLGKPVKWTATRSELFLAEWHGRSLILDGSLAMDADNNITAIRWDDEIDLGAYNCYFGGFIGSNNLSVTMGGAYKIPSMYMQSKLYFTNATPVSAYRGAGRPDIAFAIERLVDHAAAEHGLDPVAFRRQNFIPVDAFPYATPNGTTYDCGDFSSVMDKALKLSKYDSFDARRKESEAAGKLRGIGLGYYLEKSGAGGAPKDQVSCEFDNNGRIMLFAVTGPSGQGHETSFSQIVSQGLGIDDAGIGYRAGDPSQDLIGNGTGGSRSLYGAGSAFKNLIGKIIETATPHAAEHLGAKAGSVSFANGQFSAGEKSVGLIELAKSVALKDGKHPFNCEAHTVTGANYPNGCHIAEIEVDPKTGLTEVKSYVSVDDLGNIISPELVKGQVHGGVLQGLGQAFLEAIVYDETGQLLSGSFMDYAMPRAGMVGHFHSDSYAVPTQLNELGSKGVGESGCSGSLPAVSNAMMHALRSAGVGPMDMPYTPARVWKLLSEAA
ncbi:MAG: xanthine dehydrogenase family protein molybdopterin-binding subunit [Burkholderiaceae bacterium]